MKNKINTISIFLIISFFASIAFEQKLLSKEKNYSSEIKVNASSKNNSCGYDFSHGYADLIEKIMPSVVNISSTSVSDQAVSPLEQFFGNNFFGFDGHPLKNAPKIKRKMISLGSGFFIDKNGLIVTNYHVIKNASEIKIKDYNGVEHNAKIISFDAKTDLAVIKADVKANVQPVVFGSSNAARIGDIVFAIGNPFGFGGTVTSGIISGKSRALEQSGDDYLQTDAPINQGNSGGPMFNLCGEVIGINTAIISKSGGNIGIGFAIASDNSIEIINKLQKKEKIIRPWLGVEIQMLNEEMRDALNLKNNIGVYVHNVSKNSPASKCGLKIGDVIIYADSKEITEPRQLSSYVSSLPVGHKMKLKVIRDEKNIEIFVILEQSKIEVTEEKIISKTNFIGIEAQDLTSKIRQSLNIPEKIKGVVITNIKNEKILEFSALQEGDVISAINAYEISNMASFDKAISLLKKSNKKHAIFKIYRQGFYISKGIPIK